MNGSHWATDSEVADWPVVSSIVIRALVFGFGTAIVVFAMLLEAFAKGCPICKCVSHGGCRRKHVRPA